MSKKWKIGLWIFAILCIISVAFAIYEENFSQKFSEIDLKIEADGAEQKTEKLYELNNFSTGFLLNVTASGAKEIRINNKNFSGSIANFELLLKKPRTNVEIEAKNPIYNSKKEIIIQRPFSPEEQAEIDRKEKEKKILEEMKAEEKKKIEAEKDKLTKKFEKIILNQDYEYEVHNQLHSLDFKEISSGFIKAQDGSTQLEKIFQKTEGEYTITIAINGSYSIDTFYYQVVVTHISD